MSSPLVDAMNKVAGNGNRWHANVTAIQALLLIDGGAINTSHTRDVLLDRVKLGDGCTIWFYFDAKPALRDELRKRSKARPY